MGPRLSPGDRATAVAPGLPKHQGRTPTRNHCSKPLAGRYMAARTCPSDGDPAQRRFSKPMPRSDSGVRAARIQRDRNQDNPSPLATVSSAPAAARLCCRKASRPSRHGGTPKRNNSKRRGSSAHRNPPSRHVTRQKASCLLPPPAGQQPRAETVPQIRTYMRHSRRELWMTAGRWRESMFDNRTPGSGIPKLSDVA